MAGDAHEAFSMVEKIQQEEGRFFIHPFEGPKTFLGTATVGLEMCEQIADFDALIVAVGGGGLCGGMSAAVKQLRPDAQVFGVEPAGADSMLRSFKSGTPETLDEVHTIADSLGAPFALPMSFELCRNHVDEIVTVEDDEIRAAMNFLFYSQKIAIEPACAASTAALMGPLADKLRGQHVAIVMCGSNTDWNTFAGHAGIAA